MLNNNLKKAYLSQPGNWIKYAFMERGEDKLFYYCAIPRKIVVPEGFVSKEIAPCKFLHFERYDYRFLCNRENSIISNMALAPCNQGNQIPLACVDVPKELLILLDL